MKITDFIEIKDYYKKAGQSGKLGVAIDGAGKKYLLKQGHYGEPANEYVYSIIAKRVGVSCQTCHLVEGVGVPIAALEYIESISESRKNKFVCNLIIDDLVRAMTLDALTWQDDNLQYIIGRDGKFYKIDNSEAFGYSKYEEYIFATGQESIIKERLLQIENDSERFVAFLNDCKANIIKRYGVLQVSNFDEVLEKFTKTNFSFLKEDKELATVYSKEAYKYFLARINAIKTAITCFKNEEFSAQADTEMG